MRIKRILPRAGWLSARTGRWRSQKTGILLTFLGILGISLLTAAGAKAGNNIPFQEKGTNTMQQAAPAQVRNIPSLDVSQPAQVETFTFGLG
jgi:hypothetical protein